MDKKLNELLDSYKVADADAQLLERIVSQITPSASSAVVRRRFPFTLERAALLAATALIGFWLGNARLETSTASHTASVAAAESVTGKQSEAKNYQDYLDTLILGPGHLSEVSL